MGILQQRLSTRLALDFCGLLVGTLAVVGGVVAWSTYRTLEQSTFETLKVVATLKEYELTQWVLNQQANLLWLARTPDLSRRILQLQQTDPQNPRHNEAKTAIMAALVAAVESQPDFDQAMILNSSGIVLVASDRTLEGTYQALGNRTTYFDPRRPPVLNLTIYRALDSGSPRVTFAVPLVAVTGVDAVVAVHLSLASVDQIIRQETGLGNQGEAYLISQREGDGGGIFISSRRSNLTQPLDSSPAPARPDWATSPGIEAALRGEQGAGLYRNYGNLPVVGRYQWLETYNLALLVEVPQQVAFAQLYGLLQRFLVIGMLSATGGITLIVLRSRHVSKPIVAIATAAESVAQAIQAQDYAQLPTAAVTTEDEVGQLARRFNQMTEQIWASHQALTDYSRQLEGRVAERTQALEERNQQLQKTLSELQNAQAHLFQNEKMSSLGQIVAGVAHEINNPVSFIQGNLVYAKTYTQTLLSLIQGYESLCQQRGYPISPELRQQIQTLDLDFVREDFPRLVESMEHGASRIAQIVRLLQQFSRHDMSGLKKMDLHTNLDNVLILLSHRIKAEGNQKQVEVTRHYGEVPLIVADAGQLNQVFMNLITNALDVLREDTANPYPELHITTAPIDPKWVSIMFYNNGPAIPVEHQTRIFEPFFTTKTLGQGTGLGLTICHQIITQGHRGTLTVESKPHWGTEFTINLPIDPQDTEL